MNLSLGRNKARIIQNVVNILNLADKMIYTYIYVQIIHILFIRAKANRFLNKVCLSLNIFLFFIKQFPVEIFGLI